MAYLPNRFYEKLKATDGVRTTLWVPVAKDKFIFALSQFLNYFRLENC